MGTTFSIKSHKTLLLTNNTSITKGSNVEFL